MMQEILREDRLVVWDRLLRSGNVELEEVERLVTKLSRDTTEEEQLGSVLLLAVAKIATVERGATRRNLTAALRYWFSHTGTKDRPLTFVPRGLEDVGLVDLMGLYLTWPEAMRSVGGNPNDYSALKRLEQELREHCAKEWERVFGCSPPSVLTEGR